MLYLKNFVFFLVTETYWWPHIALIKYSYSFFRPYFHPAWIERIDHYIFSLVSWIYYYDFRPDFYFVKYFYFKNFCVNFNKLCINFLINLHQKFLKIFDADLLFIFNNLFIFNSYNFYNLHYIFTFFQELPAFINILFMLFFDFVLSFGIKYKFIFFFEILDIFIFSYENIKISNIFCIQPLPLFLEDLILFIFIKVKDIFFLLIFQIENLLFLFKKIFHILYLLIDNKEDVTDILFESKYTFYSVDYFKCINYFLINNNYYLLKNNSTVIGIFDDVNDIFYDVLVSKPSNTFLDCMYIYPESLIPLFIYSDYLKIYNYLDLKFDKFLFDYVLNYNIDFVQFFHLNNYNLCYPLAKNFLNEQFFEDIYNFSYKFYFEKHYYYNIFPYYFNNLFFFWNFIDLKNFNMLNFVLNFDFLVKLICFNLINFMFKFFFEIIYTFLTVIYLVVEYFFNLLKFFDYILYYPFIEEHILYLTNTDFLLKGYILMKLCNILPYFNYMINYTNIFSWEDFFILSVEFLFFDNSEIFYSNIGLISKPIILNYNTLFKMSFFGSLDQYYFYLIFWFFYIKYNFFFRYYLRNFSDIDGFLDTYNYLFFFGDLKFYLQNDIFFLLDLNFWIYQPSYFYLLFEYVYNFGKNVYTFNIFFLELFYLFINLDFEFIDKFYVYFFNLHFFVEIMIDFFFNFYIYYLDNFFSFVFYLLILLILLILINKFINFIILINLLILLYLLYLLKKENNFIFRFLNNIILYFFLIILKKIIHSTFTVDKYENLILNLIVKFYSAFGHKELINFYIYFVLCFFLLQFYKLFNYKDNKDFKLKKYQRYFFNLKSELIQLNVFNIIIFIFFNSWMLPLSEKLFNILQYIHVRKYRYFLYLSYGKLLDFDPVLKYRISYGIEWVNFFREELNNYRKYEIYNEKTVANYFSFLELNVSRKDFFFQMMYLFFFKFSFKILLFIFLYTFFRPPLSVFWNYFVSFLIEYSKLKKKETKQVDKFLTDRKILRVQYEVENWYKFIVIDVKNWKKKKYNFIKFLFFFFRSYELLLFFFNKKIYIIIFKNFFIIIFFLFNPLFIIWLLILNYLKKKNYNKFFFFKKDKSILFNFFFIDEEKKINYNIYLLNFFGIKYKFAKVYILYNKFFYKHLNYVAVNLQFNFVKLFRKNIINIVKFCDINLFIKNNFNIYIDFEMSKVNKLTIILKNKYKLTFKKKLSTIIYYYNNNYNTHKIIFDHILEFLERFYETTLHPFEVSHLNLPQEERYALDFHHFYETDFYRTLLSTEEQFPVFLYFPTYFRKTYSGIQGRPFWFLHWHKILIIVYGIAIKYYSHFFPVLVLPKKYFTIWDKFYYFFGMFFNTDGKYDFLKRENRRFNKFSSDLNIFFGFLYNFIESNTNKKYTYYKFNISNSFFDFFKKRFWFDKIFNYYHRNIYEIDEDILEYEAKDVFVFSDYYLAHLEVFDKVFDEEDDDYLYRHFFEGEKHYQRRKLGQKFILWENLVNFKLFLSKKLWFKNYIKKRNLFFNFYSLTDGNFFLDSYYQTLYSKFKFYFFFKNSYYIKKKTTNFFKPVRSFLMFFSTIDFSFVFFEYLQQEDLYWWNEYVDFFDEIFYIFKRVLKNLYKFFYVLTLTIYLPLRYHILRHLIRFISLHYWPTFLRQWYNLFRIEIQSRFEGTLYSRIRRYLIKLFYEFYWNYFHELVNYVLNLAYMDLLNYKKNHDFFYPKFQFFFYQNFNFFFIDYFLKSLSLYKKNYVNDYNLLSILIKIIYEFFFSFKFFFKYNVFNINYNPLIWIFLFYKLFFLKNFNFGNATYFLKSIINLRNNCWYKNYLKNYVSKIIFNCVFYFFKPKLNIIYNFWNIVFFIKKNKKKNNFWKIIYYYILFYIKFLENKIYIKKNNVWKIIFFIVIIIILF